MEMGKEIREKIETGFSWVSMGLMILISFGIVVYIFINGAPNVNLSFIFSEPVATRVKELSGGISTPIIGTLIVTVLGLLFSFPLSLATSLYLSEYAPKGRITDAFKLGIDILSGVPTIVIAIFSLAVFTNPQFGFLSKEVVGTNRAFGRSFFVAGISLAIMVLPYIIKTCEEAIKSVPESYRHASLALGATKWQTSVKIVLLSAKNGIITAIAIGFGKIIGETVIVWLTMGALRLNTVNPVLNPINMIRTLKNTGPTLTTYIFYNSPAGDGNLSGKAFAASLVLLVIIIILNIFLDVLSKNRSEGV